MGTKDTSTENPKDYYEKSKKCTKIMDPNSKYIH